MLKHLKAPMISLKLRIEFSMISKMIELFGLQRVELLIMKYFLVKI
jgi:hypothetical protein